MRIQILSDLHLENQPGFVAQAVPGADVLVLAGDIGSYQAGSRLAEDDFGLGRFSPRRGAPWRTVLYVPGNHEYDGLEFDATHRRLRDCCEALGIVWLERQVHTLGPVRFIGTTLWSDFDALASAGTGPGDLAHTLRQRGKAFRAANYYLSKYSALRDGRPMLAEDLRDLALECQAWLRQALAEPFDGRTVVVTHFAPSLRSADPRYGLVPGTAGFCNALDELLQQAELWIHGHVHCALDYLVARPAATGPCRVLANPLGYAHKGEQATFRSDFSVLLAD